MLYELEATQHAKLAPLFRALDIHLATRAILEGSTHAQVWVDNPRNPQTALVRAGQRFFLTGRTHDDVFNDAVRRLYAETIYPQAIQAGNEMFTLYYAPDGWEYEMDVLLKDKFPMRRERQYYRFKKMKYDWRALLPDGFVLQFVNAALLESPQIKNLDALKEEMRSERASVEDFLAKSFGVIALHDNTLAGWCLSEYNCGSACEIGIATTEPYQKRGVATAMASAFVEHAHTRGITQIGWHCYTSNTPSVATALKVGFEKVRGYSVYLAWFDETENLTANGNMRLLNQQYAEALTWYEQTFARGTAHQWAYFGAARAAAMLGRRDDALRYLARAIDEGFGDLQRIKNSEHLASLRDTDEWQMIIARLEERQTTSMTPPRATTPA